MSRNDRNIMNSDDLAKKIIELGQNKEFNELQKLIVKCDTKLVCISLFILFVGKFILMLMINNWFRLNERL